MRAAERRQSPAAPPHELPPVPGLLRVMGYDAPPDPCRRHLWQRSRGHSKTGDAGLLASWCLAVSQRPVRILAVAGGLKVLVDAL